MGGACGGPCPLPAPSRNRGSAPDPAPQTPEGLSGVPVGGAKWPRAGRGARWRGEWPRGCVCPWAGRSAPEVRGCPRAECRARVAGFLSCLEGGGALLAA
ncbi:hypothetical protein E6R60_32020 [Streptomyces sp. A0642]|nr:hypothetical protein E6R60_32020 [Streptomyces sp. A0642]